MKYIFKILIVLLSFQCAFSQESTIKEIDSLYKEDQFYLGVTYNLLGQKPDKLSQNGFSTGLHFGFINDMPLNENRNVALGVGLGVSINSFNQNLLIDKDNPGAFTYSLLDGNSTYSKNKFYRNLIELPIEFRWRTSTPTEYKFWRIYTGFKLGYIITSDSKFKGQPESIKYHNINDFNKLQYGLTLSAGYNTWNLYLYYGLNPIFSKDAVLNGNAIDINAIKVGLMFYVL
ncbi:porin family protein [Mariniflexile sp.]|uniref:porin family protein n=1 Tax=Mariniflexile sp. TaxID=1979402 RepID=UPI004047B72B